MSKEKEYCRRLSVQGVGVYEELLVLCREVSLPWCGVLYEGCTGLLYNGGLYTQCGVKSEGKYCVGCIGIKESGKWKGDVSDRMKCKIGEYSVGGKKEISYMKWLSKKGVSREMAEREASSRGISIPLVHFEGGILKEKEAIVEAVVEAVVEPIVEPVVELVVEPVVEVVVESSVEPVVELVVEPIVVPVVESSVEPVVVPVVEPIVEVVVESCVEPVVEAIVEPVVESCVEPVVEAIVEAIVEPVVESCVEPVVEAIVEAIVEPVKKKRGRPRKEKSVSSNNEGEDLIASLLNERKDQEKKPPVENEESPEEEETLVIKIEIDGKTYLKSEDNTVFDFMSHDELGRWNEKENKIVLG
jgi:hypothetical protein